MRLRRGVGLAVAFLAAWAIASPASAAQQRYAEPGGNGPVGTCPQADPCSLQSALEDPSVNNGDEVILLPGDYVETESLQANDGLDVHGVAGAPRPRIFNSGVQGLLVASFSAPTRIAHLELYHSGVGQGIGAISGVFEDVFVRSSKSQCDCHGFGSGGVVRNSVCWGVNADGIVCSCGGSGFDSTTTLRNVTLIASGAGKAAIHSWPSGGAKIRYEARNVIANAEFADLFAEAQDSSSVASIDLDFSNFDSVQTSPQAGSSASQPGSASNQTAAPVFVDAASGDFHQASGSPTVNAGTEADGIGDADIDGEPRIQGHAPDIGADESPFDTDPPDTQIVKGPKKKTKKRKAKFQFAADEAASFQCSLDGRDFAPCGANAKFKVKRRRHTLAVRAVDAGGNVDPTPAEAKWKVKKKRKKK